MRMMHMLLLGSSCIVSAVHANSFLQGISFFSPRSQATNAARELIDDQIFLYHNELKPSHFFTIALSYHQSLQQEQLANIIFGTETFTIIGSGFENREINGLLADHFGLSPTFKSVVKIKPRFKNLVIPLTGYFSLDHCIEGLYLRVHVPFVWNQSRTRIEETVVSESVEPFPAGYMDIPEVAPIAKTFTQALEQCDTTPFVAEPLRFGRYDEKQHEVTLANSVWDLGWHHDLDYDRHFGIKLRVVTPNSTRPQAEYLYEPLVGNQRHWEVGFGINGHTKVWNHNDEQELSVYGNLLFTHLFASRQNRSFDLKDNGFMSRYMLVKEFDTDGTFNGNLSPLINHTTLPCHVHMTAQLDGAVMFSYTYKQCVFDLGYNGWIRTKESIELCQQFPENRFALKGIQSVADEFSMFTATTERGAKIFGNSLSQQATLTDNPSPQFIKHTDLDLKSARSPVVFSHKLFAYCGYTGGRLQKCRTLQPHVGFGGDIEFQGINESNNEVCTTDKLTMSQWSFYLKAGLIFG